MVCMMIGEHDALHHGLLAEVRGKACQIQSFLPQVAMVQVVLRLKTSLTKAIEISKCQKKQSYHTRACSLYNQIILVYCTIFCWKIITKMNKHISFYRTYNCWSQVIVHDSLTFWHQMPINGITHWATGAFLGQGDRLMCVG